MKQYVPDGWESQRSVLSAVSGLAEIIKVVGVKIAIRDMAKPVSDVPNSQIYHWGLKKNASLDGGSSRSKELPSESLSSGVSSDPFNNSIFNSPEKINNNFSQGGKLPASIAEDVYTLRSRAQGTKTAFASTNAAMKNAPFKEGAGDGGRVSTVPEELSPVARLRNAGVQAEQSVNTDLKTLPMEEASTVIDTDPAHHTDAQQRMIEEYQASVDDNLVNFVAASVANKGANIWDYNHCGACDYKWANRQHGSCG